MYVQNDNVTYFDSFGAEHIPKEIKEFVKNKNTTTNIFRIQAFDSIMCEYLRIGLIDFMFVKKLYLNIQILFNQITLRKMTI